MDMRPFVGTDAVRVGDADPSAHKRPFQPSTTTTPTRSTKLKPNLPSPSETSTNSSTPPTMHERTIAYRPAFLRDVKRLKNKHYNMNTHSNGR